MTVARPALGYASLSEAAAALRDRGWKHRMIAQALDVNERSVGNLIANGRRKTKRSKVPALDRQLRREARRRQVTPHALASALLSAVLRDGLIDAILDGDQP